MTTPNGPLTAKPQSGKPIRTILREGVEGGRRRTKSLRPKSCTNGALECKAARPWVLGHLLGALIACHSGQSSKGRIDASTADAGQGGALSSSGTTAVTPVASIVEASSSTTPDQPQDYELIGYGAMELATLNHCRKLQAAQAALLADQYHAASRKVAEALRDGSDPASQQLRRIDQAMQEARAKAQSLAELSIHRKNAESAQSAQGLPALHTLTRVKCWETTQRGLWAVSIAEPVLNEPGDWLPSHWNVSGPYEIVHVSRTGQVVRLVVPRQNDGFDEIFDSSPLLVDLSGDAEQEVLWSLSDAYGRVRTVAFASTRGAVKPVANLRIPGSVWSVSIPGGIRPRIEYRVHFGDSADCGSGDSDDEVEHFPSYDSPGFIAEVIDGKLALDTPAARDAVRQWCPRPPPDNWHTATEVLCARLWGQPATTLIKRLKSGFAWGGCQDPGATQLPLQGRTTEYGAMMLAARWKPPFRLRAADSQHAR
jgi:hypothetical protein